MFLINKTGIYFLIISELYVTYYVESKSINRHYG